MYTIIETPTFTKQSKDIWSDEELGAFCLWLAKNPEAGDVIANSGGCRKVRWALGGKGKSGGARVIYFNTLEDGTIWLLTMYAKKQRGTIPAHYLKAIREAIKNG